MVQKMASIMESSTMRRMTHFTLFQVRQQQSEDQRMLELMMLTLNKKLSLLLPPYLMTFLKFQRLALKLAQTSVLNVIH